MSNYKIAPWTRPMPFPGIEFPSPDWYIREADVERREDEERRVEDAEGGQERGEEITHPTFFLKKTTFSVQK